MQPCQTHISQVDHSNWRTMQPCQTYFSQVVHSIRRTIKLGLTYQLSWNLDLEVNIASALSCNKCSWLAITAPMLISAHVRSLECFFLISKPFKTVWSCTLQGWVLPSIWTHIYYMYPFSNLNRRLAQHCEATTCLGWKIRQMYAFLFQTVLFSNNTTCFEIIVIMLS